MSTGNSYASSDRIAASRQIERLKASLADMTAQRDALLTAHEARELVLEHYKHCVACMHNEQCDVGFDLQVNEHGLRQAAIAAVTKED